MSVVRIRTPTLWEALATAVLRQVVRAETARARYWRLVGQLSDGGGAFPSPQAVLAASQREMIGLGLGFSWAKLVSIATWAEEAGAHHLQSDAEVAGLLMEASHLLGVGPWTLGIAGWDCTGDPRYYPVGDYVVQAGAQRLWPQRAWARRPSSFDLEWREFAGKEVEHATVLALLAADAAAWQALCQLSRRTIPPVGS